MSNLQTFNKAVLALQPEADKDLEILLMSADALMPASRARVAWRYSDSLWNSMHKSIAYCRAFNNAVQEKQSEERWPWVENLWKRDEI